MAGAEFWMLVPGSSSARGPKTARPDPDRAPPRPVRPGANLKQHSEKNPMGSTIIEPGLSGGALDIHRALASLQEELEAIDFYNQRADVSRDGSLKAVLDHNRDDEMEHAVMLMEWLRRNMPEFDLQMGKILFKSGSIPDIAKGKTPAADHGRGLGLGDLK
jgi:hypothetical protein